MINKNLKVEKVLIQDVIFEKLKNMILKGDFKIGEKLPSENELSDIFGVNRLTIRLAIQKLNILGITETKVGKGTYIIDFNMNNYMSQISSIVGNQSLDDVLEFRKLIEIDSAVLAIERGTDEEIKKAETVLESYLDIGRKLINRPDKSYDEELFKTYILRDYQFHEEIVKMSHNNVYISAYAIVKDPIKEYIYNILKDRVIENGTIKIIENDMHIDCIEAIKKKDKDLLIEKYEQCIDYKLDIDF